MAKKSTKIVKISKPLSLELWSLLNCIKGRKKGLIAIIGTGLMMLIQDSELVALASGMIFEGALSVAIFYLSKVEVTQ